MWHCLPLATKWAEPEPKVQKQNPYEWKKNINGVVKSGWASVLKAGHKCGLAYLYPQSDLKHLVQNQNHYETNLNGQMKRFWAFAPNISHKCDLGYL